MTATDGQSRRYHARPPFRCAVGSRLRGRSFGLAWPALPRTRWSLPVRGRFSRLRGWLLRLARRAFRRASSA